MEMKVVFILAMCQKQGDHAEKTCFLSTSHLGCATLPQPQAKGRSKPFLMPNSLLPLGPQGGYVQEIRRPCHSFPNGSCLPAITLVLRAPRPAQSVASSTPAHGPGLHFSSAQCCQSLPEQCHRNAGLQLHHSHALPFREQELPDTGNSQARGGQGWGSAPCPPSTV